MDAAQRRPWSGRLVIAARRVDVVHLAIVHWYAAFGLLWPVLLILYPPQGPALALGSLVYTIAATALFGAGWAIVGTLLGCQTGTARNRGMLAELIGLLFLQAAAVSYFITQFFLVFGPTGAERIGPTAYQYAMCCAFGVRMVFVGIQVANLGHPERQRLVVR